MQIIYELFFKSLWQVLMYIKQELEYSQSNNKIIRRREMMSINKLTSTNYPLIYKYPKEHNRRKYTNQNMNKISSRSTIDTQIVLIPVRSSYCQTEMWKTDLQTINIDLNQSEKNIDTFCRRLDEPLIFMNREIYCRYNRTTSFSTKPSGIKEELH